MQAYSDPKRENDPHALPDLEVFYLSARQIVAEDITNDEGERREPGWYWWACMPGCMPDSDMTGPFEDENAAQVKWIRDELESGNEWAWFVAKVTATHPDIPDLEGVDYLGACSYTSAEDFKTPGGYYDYMKEEAARDLLAKIVHVRDVANKAGQ